MNFIKCKYKIIKLYFKYTWIVCNNFLVISRVCCWSVGSLKVDKSSSRVLPPVPSDKIVNAVLILSGDITTFPSDKSFTI